MKSFMSSQAQSQPPSQSQAALSQISHPHLNALDLAYRQTHYQVFSEEKTISVRVDNQNSMLDQLVRQHGHNRWALITAYNPYSQPLTALANQVRNKALAKKLWSIYWPIFRAVGQDDAGQWPSEESFFVIGIGEEDAMALGQKYEQNAILVGEVNHSPQLIWLR